MSLTAPPVSHDDNVQIQMVLWACPGPFLGYMIRVRRFALDGKRQSRHVNGTHLNYPPSLPFYALGWKEREIFGKIRFMNYNGCKRKFKVETFVGKYKGASKNALEAEKKHRNGKTSQPPKKKQKKL